MAWSDDHLTSGSNSGRCALVYICAGLNAANVKAGFGVPVGGPLSEMVVAGVADRGGAVGRSGLGEDPVDVAFDGLSTDVELGCDVGVRHSPGHHGEDL